MSKVGSCCPRQTALKSNPKWTPNRTNIDSNATQCKKRSHSHSYARTHYYYYSVASTRNYPLLSRQYSQIIMIYSSPSEIMQQKQAFSFNFILEGLDRHILQGVTIEPSAHPIKNDVKHIKSISRSLRLRHPRRKCVKSVAQIAAQF